MICSEKSCVPFRWQGNWIRRGAKRPENPVTRFPAGRRGPRSGEGVYEGKKRKDTLRLSRPPNGGQAGSGVSHRRLTSYTLCHCVAFPSRGNKGLRRESYCVICFLYHSRGTPFGGWRHHLSSAKAGHYGCWAFRAKVLSNPIKQHFPFQNLMIK